MNVIKGHSNCAFMPSFIAYGQ